VVAEDLAALALRSLAAGHSAETNARALAIALSRRVPRCLVTVSLGLSVLEAARAGSSVEFPKEEFLRLVSTGSLPLDPRKVPLAHRDRWVEPLVRFLDPARYAASPVGRLMSTLGMFYFGRHYVCDGGRLVACICVWLPREIDCFSDDEVSVLSSSATALGPLLRLQAVASLSAEYEGALLHDVERRGEAAFLLGPTGAVRAASVTGEALLTARPDLRRQLERLDAEPGGTLERAFPTLGLRLIVTGVPTVGRAHRLVTATPLSADGAQSLTQRQREVLDYVENGLNNREIGLVMGLSPATVKTMLQRLYERTGTTGRMELVRWRRSGS
jgi:DNA-binding CsgD family transcriptional regulator